MNRGGDVLMAWNVGPMATDSTFTVKWALYRSSPDATGSGGWRVVDAGTLGSSFSGTKPHVLVGHDDKFYLSTTASGPGAEMQPQGGPREVATTGGH